MEHIADYLEALAERLRNGEIEVALDTKYFYEDIIEIDYISNELCTRQGKVLPDYYVEQLTITPAKRSTMG